MLQTTLAIYYLLSFTVQENATAEITVNQAGKSTVLTGRILEEASEDDGVLFQTREGRLWPLQGEQIENKQYKTSEFEPIARKQYGRDLRSELGANFKILEAANFVLVYNTEKAYARWVSGLYKKFERGFKGFWNKGKHKFKLVSKPEFPLAVIIFKSRREYEKYMADDLGVVNPAMLAYYNLETNRVVMFDLTAREFQIQGEVNDRRINEVLNNPKAIHMVATIVHEGTHQLMFNYGMQVRYSDTPLWLNEGMAMFFETPDLTAERGWRAIGELNFIRLGQFLNYTQRRPENSLKSMLTSDEGFRSEAALDIYSQAWAFNYFLLKKHRGSFIEYLKFMSNKQVLRYDTPEQRLADFQQFFQTPLQELDREFLRYFQSLER